MKHIALLLALASTAAQAEFFDGNLLLSRLTDTSSASIRSSALGYVAGVSDTSFNVFHCMPPTVSLKQAADVVTLALEASPTDRHLTADALVIRAFRTAWPCQKKERGSSL